MIKAQLSAVCLANPVALDFQNRWHRFWLLDATGPCNKILILASLDLGSIVMSATMCVEHV